MAVTFRVPPSVVFDWPDSDVSLLAEFLSKDPGPDRRVEIGLAQIATLYLNAHRRKGKPAHKVSDLLRFDDVWTPKADPHDTAAAFALSFGMVKRGNNHS